MKSFALLLFLCLAVGVSANNGTPDVNRAHTAKQHEALSPEAALAPPAPHTNTYSATAVVPQEVSAPGRRSAFTKSSETAGVSFRKATDRLSKEELKAQRKARRIEKFQERAAKASMNSTTSILVGILVALVVVLAFSIDTTFGLILLLAAAIAALFILLR